MANGDAAEKETRCKRGVIVVNALESGTEEFLNRGREG